MSEYAPFRPGCVVRLKGQSVRMTVISGSDADPVRRCAWFKVDGSLEIMPIAVVALEDATVDEYAWTKAHYGSSSRPVAGDR